MESSVQNAMFLNEDMSMDNVQNHDKFTEKMSPTFSRNKKWAY
jgi:hypothetical protein